MDASDTQQSKNEERQDPATLGSERKTPSIDDIVSDITESFRSKPWLADSWRNAGIPLIDSVEFEVEYLASTVRLKFPKKMFEAALGRIAKRIEENIACVTLKNSGHFKDYSQTSE